MSKKKIKKELKKLRKEIEKIRNYNDPVCETPDFEDDSEKAQELKVKMINYIINNGDSFVRAGRGYVTLRKDNREISLEKYQHSIRVRYESPASKQNIYFDFYIVEEEEHFESVKQIIDVSFLAVVRDFNEFDVAGSRKDKLSNLPQFTTSN
jgi:hypothetical protein